MIKFHVMTQALCHCLLPAHLRHRSTIHTVCVFAFLVAQIPSITALHAKSNDRPNIIYILADDLGYGDLGCYGQRIIQTPNLDQMAGEGIRFTRHYAGSTVCAPSRGCLLEGKHTGHTYVRGNGELQMRPDPDDPIFPRALQQAGYHTALIGKSGLGCNTDDARLINQKGFDHFFGFTSHTQAHWYYPKYLWRNATRIEYENNDLHDGDHYSSELVIEEALQYIDAHRRGPFFLHLSLQIPHASLRAKEFWKEKYRSILKEEPLPPAKHRHYSYEREPKTTYAAMVSYLDHNIGRLLEKLRDLEITENTLVMFASDNGAMHEGGHRIEHFDSNGELRGGKRDLYEGGIRTPMIAWWPGRIDAGQVTDQISAFWDISPTLRELAGAKPQVNTDGHSLVPTLLGPHLPGHALPEQREQDQHEYLYWEFYEGSGKRAVLREPWKLILFDTNREQTPRQELFNLESDPGEQTDVAAEYPEQVAELRKLMDAAHVIADRSDFRLAHER